ALLGDAGSLLFVAEGRGATFLAGLALLLGWSRLVRWRFDVIRIDRYAFGLLLDLRLGAFVILGNHLLAPLLGDVEVLPRWLAFHVEFLDVVSLRPLQRIDRDLNVFDLH